MRIILSSKSNSVHLDTEHEFDITKYFRRHNEDNDDDYEIKRSILIEHVVGIWK